MPERAGDKRAEDAKPETEEACANRLVCHLWQLCHYHLILIDFPHFTEKELKVSAGDNVNATRWDTWARKDVRRGSEYSRNPQFCDMSCNLVECEFSHAPPSRILEEKREKRWKGLG